MQEQKKILLSFDVEEFDLPIEYKQNISIDQQLEFGYKGLPLVTSFLDAEKIISTFFTTAFFAENFANEIKKLSSNHEIASHAYYHSSFKNEDLKNSKQKIETIIGKQIYGLRMPRMRRVATNVVIEAGYTYNSSINPTLIPGRYNHLNAPRKFFIENSLMQFPVSVTPHLRIPLFWLAFKNLPYSLFLKLALQTIRHDGYLCLYFHPWEFIDLSGFKLPGYVTRGGDKKLFEKLKKLLKDLSSEGEFITMNEFVNSHTS